MAKTPPKNIQFIPGVSPSKTMPAALIVADNNNTNDKLAEKRRESASATLDTEQFEMDL